MINTEPKVQRVELRAMKNDSQTLKSNQVTLIICLARFQNCCGLLTPFYFPFPPLLIWNVYSCNAVLISLYVGCVGSTSWVSSFTCAQMESNYGPGAVLKRLEPVASFTFGLDLDYSVGCWTLS